MRSSALVRSARVVVAAPTTSLIPFAAAATPPDPRLTDAARRCASGDARVGVALLMRVHVETMDPGLILEQATCYERNGHLRQAADRLEFYLDSVHQLPEAERIRIEARVVFLRQQSASLPRQRTVSDVRRVAIKRQAYPQSLTERREGADEPGMSRRRMTSLLLAGAAGGVVGGAFTLQLARENRAAEYNRRCYPLRAPDCDQMLGGVKAAQIGALVGYVGAALLAGGSAYLYVTSPERRRGVWHALRCRPGGASGEIVCGAFF